MEVTLLEGMEEMEHPQQLLEAVLLILAVVAVEQ
jgi:hypothetical protein